MCQLNRHYFRDKLIKGPSHTKGYENDNSLYITPYSTKQDLHISVLG